MLRLSESDPYLRGLSIWVGFKQDFVMYRRQARFTGITHFSLLSKGPVKEFVRGLASFSAAPLYFALLIGFTTTAASLGLGGLCANREADRNRSCRNIRNPDRHLILQRNDPVHDRLDWAVCRPHIQ